MKETLPVEMQTRSRTRSIKTYSIKALIDELHAVCSVEQIRFNSRHSPYLLWTLIVINRQQNDLDRRISYS